MPGICHGAFPNPSLYLVSYSLEQAGGHFLRLYPSLAASYIPTPEVPLSAPMTRLLKVGASPNGPCFFIG